MAAHAPNYGGGAIYGGGGHGQMISGGGYGAPSYGPAYGGNHGQMIGGGGYGDLTGLGEFLDSVF